MVRMIFILEAIAVYNPTNPITVFCALLLHIYPLCRKFFFLLALVFISSNCHTPDFPGNLKAMV